MGPINLLYDYVPLIKNIRNLWLTEKTGELKFQHEKIFLVANWHHLRNLLCWRCQNFLKQPFIQNPLNDSVEVATCLQVFFFFFFFFFVKKPQQNWNFMEGSIV